MEIHYMTIELLELRLQEIAASAKQLSANFSMLEGGRLECEYWIKKLKEDKTELVLED